MKLSNTIADLIVTSLHEGTGYLHLDKKIIELLLHQGCDYYEIVKLLSALMLERCSQEDVEILQALAPDGKLLNNLKYSSIRSMIPRWTGTKYHTAPIAFVVEDIQKKVNTKQTGIFSYHSNLNPRNKNSTDDQYVLLITKSKVTFVDINRRWNHTYLYNAEVPENVKDSNM